MIMIAGMLRQCGMLYRQQSIYRRGRRRGSARRDPRRAVRQSHGLFSCGAVTEFSTASLITRSTNDVQMVQQATVMMLRLACFAPIMGIGAVIKALRTSVSLSWTIGDSAGW